MQDKTNKFSENVNVTMHKALFGEKELIYARVHRETAFIGNIIDKIHIFNKNLDRDTLLFASGLLKKGILELLKEGKAVDVLNLGVLYLKPNGSFESADIANMPKMTLSFTPSDEAVDMVKDVSVAGDITKSSSPTISSIFDMHKEESTDSLSKGYTMRIKGDKLKIAGDEEETGIFFAPCDTKGSYSSERATWVHIKTSLLIDNTGKTIVFNLPEDTKDGTYRLIVRTAYGSGKRVNKTLREGIYENIVAIN